MFHILAFSESLGTTANTQLDALTDGIVNIQNANFLFEVDVRLLAGWFASVNADRARIVTPKVRQFTRPYIRPVDGGAATPSNRTLVADWRQSPFLLRQREEISIEATHSGGVAERATAVLVCGIDFTPAPAGDVYTMRGTSTNTATANAWTVLATVTWEDTLPIGQYAVVGLMSQSTNAQAARLTFERQYWRPGCLGNTSIQHDGHRMFRMGGLGVWGYFQQQRMPTVEVLCNGADASHVFYLDLVRVG